MKPQKSTAMSKIEDSIALIRKGEKLALALNPENGYFVGFSGGKDSQVFLDLVKRSGVKFQAYYSVTTIDPPDNVRFIRNNYPEVRFIHPKKSFFKLVETRGLPTIFARWCCAELKEGAGAGNVVLTGVRADENSKRAKYDEVSIKSRRKEHAFKKRRTIEEIEQNKHRCIKGKDAIMVYPLLHWTEKEVWEYIRENNLPINPCYELSGRVGCMFCPFAKKGQIDYYCEKYPKYREAFIKHFSVYLERNPRQTVDMTAEQYFDWWKSKKSIKEWIGDQQQTKIEL